VTDEVCPRCGKGTHLVLGARLCLDRVHCMWANLDHRHLVFLRDAFELLEAA
jgi:hypothetical protein